MTRDILSLQLRGRAIQVVSDGEMVGYVNLMTGSAFCLPLDQMEHQLRLAKAERVRKAGGKKDE